MESITIDQRLRPLRYAFMVNPGDASSALTAVSLNTVVWGGIYNPIVPTEPEATCVGLLTVFDPDYLVNLTPRVLPDRLAARFKDRVIAQNELFRAEEPGGSTRRLTLGFGMGPIMWHIYKNLLGEGTKASPAAYVGAVPEDWTTYTSFVFGGLSGLPDGGSSFIEHYRGVLAATKVDFDPSEDRDFREWRFPINATAFGIKRLGGGGSFSSHIVYVGDHANFDDLVEFWNIRCTGREIAFLSIGQYRNQSQIIKTIIKEGRYRFGINLSVESHADIQKGKSLSEAQFAEVREWVCGLKIEPAPFRDWSPRFGESIPFYVGDIHAATLEAESSQETALFHDGQLTPVKLVQPLYLDDDRLTGDHRWAVEVMPSTLHSSDEWMSRLPCAPGANDILPNYTLRSDALRVSPAGLVVSPEYPAKQLHIFPVRTFDVIAGLVRHATGLRTEFSHPGRYADRIIRKMGSLQFGCRVFKLRGVREVIDKLSKGDSLKRGDICAIIRRTSADTSGSRNWVEDFYKGFAIGQGSPVSNVNAVFDVLLEKKVLRPGLQLTCPNCFGSDWYHVSEIDEHYACHYCFERQRVPFGSKPDWQYKADGLFRLPDSAQGSLAVILALWRLSHDHFTTDGRYITSVKLGNEYEMDYCWLGMSSSSSACELVLGEARNFVDYVGRDIEKLAQLADRFEEKPFLAFATLKDRFAEPEKSLLRGLAERGYRLLPFTRMELDPYDIWSRFDDKYIRRANLPRLSEILVHVNLGQ